MPYTVKLPPKERSPQLQGGSPCLPVPATPVTSVTPLPPPTAEPDPLSSAPPSASRGGVDPWPDTLPSGNRRIGPFGACVRCGAGSWARYGDTILCAPCANAASDATRSLQPSRDLVSEYRAVLSRLWLLNLPAAERSPEAYAADVADVHRLLAQQAELCDELGPAFAEAVSREHAQMWFEVMKACPGCGTAGVFHVTEPEP